MPFCQGGMFIHWQAEVVDKGCQHMAKASFGIGTLWWMKLLLKMCHSKINKRLTGQRWMVLYSTNPWWTHTSWNFTHFGWYLKTGLSTSSNMLQKGNNWHKIWFFFDTIPPKICLQLKHASHRMMEFYCQPGWKSSSWKWPGRVFHDDVQLHIDCKYIETLEFTLLALLGTKNRAQFLEPFRRNDSGCLYIASLHRSPTRIVWSQS